MIKYIKKDGDIIIRSALLNDVPKLIKISHLFFSYGNLNTYGITIDEKSINTCIETMINNDNLFVILCCEYKKNIIGTISGVISPWITNTNNKLLIEQWWWVDKEYRNMNIDKYLLNSFEDIGKNNNCIAVIMVSLNNTRKGFERYYQRKGYELLEKNYIKRL